MGGRPGSIAPYLRIGGLIALSLAVALLLAASIGGDEIADDTTVLRRAESVLGTTTLVDLTARETLANARTWSHGETTSDQLDRANAASADMVGRLRDQTSRLEEAVAAKHGLGGSSIAQSMADLDRAAEEMATAIDARRIDEAGQVAETRLEPAIAALMTKVTSLRDDREAHIASVSEGLGLVVDAGRFLVALTLAVLVWTLIVGAKRLGQKDTLPTSLDTESELHRKREVFLAAASHHINTPLTGVVGLAELLEDRTRDLNGGVRSEIIDLLAIQARETAHVVDDILVAARSDLSELIVFEDKVDVRRVVEQAISGIGSTLRSRVTIRGHGIADADRKWVEHIVRNLIRNAGSYGGENIGVRIHTVHSKVVVDVADDGDGLPTGAEDVVFRTPYY
ncbi:MAG TPA: histidine kinase dimerization/phospho-acceptor domain-containing protein, partial [Acidimicrobiia bacterium]